MNTHGTEVPIFFFSFFFWTGCVVAVTTTETPAKARRKRHSPVAVVLVFVVASQRRHGAQADGVGEEDLSPRIDPHLVEGRWGGGGGES